MERATRGDPEEAPLLFQTLFRPVTAVWLE